MFPESKEKPKTINFPYGALIEHLSFVEKYEYIRNKTGGL